MTDNDPATRRTGPAISLRGVGRTFGDRAVLQGVDLAVAQHEFVVLVGASGCGKSTLLRIVAGLDSDATGEVQVAGEHAIVFQDARLLPWRPVWRNVAFGLRGPRAELRARADRALAEVGLPGRGDSWPLTLSGGEAQRVALARALVRTPDLLLLDEPFAALDALTRLKMQRQVAELWRHHEITTLMVTHDVEEALLLADRVLLVDSGRIAEEIPVGLPRPRDPRDAGFAALRHRLLLSLGVDLSGDRGHAPTRAPAPARTRARTHA
ncbi:ABC transporter ATP-binding protein [Actinomadura livida]|uniref:ABC transporter ATP-binding protein n=1 Tax=Actinomadura livida TaxID=79909 RepID=A0A7W7IJD9_9ACTN|nr:MULTISPECIES: ABC transporter ATP-binding protein [Actinomadura]MBB4778090.1 sulfonate transport system ATP-binding protein [Actinomadura catellatispora]GGT96624.1 aliphatic sulfonates import ATP-binding protein SsuB 1 [Actinomadura livida]